MIHGYVTDHTNIDSWYRAVYAHIPMKKSEKAQFVYACSNNQWHPFFFNDDR